MSEVEHFYKKSYRIYCRGIVIVFLIIGFMFTTFYMFPAPNALIK